MTAKEILLKIKAAFDFPAAPPATPPAAPAIPTVPTAKVYKLTDGVTDISIMQAGEYPAAGDMVTINGAPAPANTYTLADGATIVVDATGAIATYTAMAAPAPPPPAAPPAPAVPITLTAEAVQEMYAKFATGSTEERMANLETMVKALMECSFGYEIRKGIEQEAVQAYKDSVALQVSNLMASSQTSLDEQKAINIKNQETIAGLFELAELLVNAPSVEPVTLTDSLKLKFDRQSAKDQRLQKMAEALKANKALA
jgi:hypothetical protein